MIKKYLSNKNTQNKMFLILFHVLHPAVVKNKKKQILYISKAAIFIYLFYHFSFRVKGYESSGNTRKQSDVLEKEKNNKDYTGLHLSLTLSNRNDEQRNRNAGRQMVPMDSYLACVSIFFKKISRVILVRVSKSYLHSIGFERCRESTSARRDVKKGKTVEIETHLSANVRKTIMTKWLSANFQLRCKKAKMVSVKRE